MKYEIDGTPGVWMRTHGAPLLGLPDFAAHADGHHEGKRYFEIFDNVMSYLQQSGATMAAGHTIQVGDDEFLRCRAPKKGEKFLKGEGELLVVEIIGRDEISR